MRSSQRRAELATQKRLQAPRIGPSKKFKNMISMETDQDMRKRILDASRPIPYLTFMSFDYRVKKKCKSVRSPAENESSRQLIAIPDKNSLGLDRIKQAYDELELDQSELVYPHPPVVQKIRRIKTSLQWNEKQCSLVKRRKVYRLEEKGKLKFDNILFQKLYKKITSKRKVKDLEFSRVQPPVKLKTAQRRILLGLSSLSKENRIGLMQRLSDVNSNFADLRALRVGLQRRAAESEQGRRAATSRPSKESS